ncbi:MAG: glutathione transport system substrate-binding protein, partial [Thermoleophilaceae bacterium]|nr:glutathione transport system substrate-binding protein [Thermoleophilaceae bacterium]
MKTRWTIALILVLVAGCGGGSETKSSSAPTASGTQGGSGVKASDINPQPRDKLKDGGQVIWVVDQYSSQWNY